MLHFEPGPVVPPLPPEPVPEPEGLRVPLVPLDLLSLEPEELPRPSECPLPVPELAPGPLPVPGPVLDPPEPVVPEPAAPEPDPLPLPEAPEPEPVAPEPEPEPVVPEPVPSPELEPVPPVPPGPVVMPPVPGVLGVVPIVPRSRTPVVPGVPVPPASSLLQPIVRGTPITPATRAARSVYFKWIIVCLPGSLALPAGPRGRTDDPARWSIANPVPPGAKRAGLGDPAGRGHRRRGELADGRGRVGDQLAIGIDQVCRLAIHPAGARPDLVEAQVQEVVLQPLARPAVLPLDHREQREPGVADDRHALPADMVDGAERPFQPRESARDASPWRWSR